MKKIIYQPANERQIRRGDFEREEKSNPVCGKTVK